MGTRKTVTDRGIEFEVIWDGAWNSKSLLGNYPRPSALADLVPDHLQSTKLYVSRKGRDGRRVTGPRRAHQ